MIEEFVTDRKTLLRLRSGPLGAHIDGFAHSLSKQGYARYTAKQKIGVVGALSVWMRRRHLGAKDLDEQRTQEFVAYRRKRGRVHRSDVAALGSLLRYLREDGVIPRCECKAKRCALERILDGYAQYLVQERGLSQATLANYIPSTRSFLSQRFGAAAVHLGRLRVPDISQFILRRARQVGVLRVQLEVTALRSFFRFLCQRGQISRNLADAVPSISNRGAATVPKYLEPHEVEALLESCDLSNAIGRRDHAILLLLARLGLRAGEVVHLVLEDIDWQTGELIVRGKSARHGRLPIPHDVGQALAGYLRQDRPCCPSRRVFLRARAPYGEIASSATICDIVRNALSRAGLTPRFKGSHLLRHSLATHMLGKGSSLAEIGEVLRHQLPSSTEIYAKVNLVALRALAQPWKGGTP